jgi:extradiol dioxygenase family protein
MRSTGDVFHLAIPVRDLDEALDFYVTRLGCHLARRYDDRITIDFFGDQLVGHLSDEWERDPKMYPRHFGVTFRERADFEAVLRCAERRDIRFFSLCQPRFKDTPEEHLTFVLQDPSGNLLEFKHYHDPRMMY